MFDEIPDRDHLYAVVFVGVDARDNHAAIPDNDIDARILNRNDKALVIKYRTATGSPGE